MRFLVCVLVICREAEHMVSTCVVPVEEEVPQLAIYSKFKMHFTSMATTTFCIKTYFALFTLFKIYYIIPCVPS